MQKPYTKSYFFVMMASVLKSTSPENKQACPKSDFRQADRQNA